MVFNVHNDAKWYKVASKRELAVFVLGLVVESDVGV